MPSLNELCKSLIPSAHPILPNLWLGDLQAGNIARLLPDFDVLNVHEDLVGELGGFACGKSDGNGGWVLLTEGLDKAAEWIDDRWVPDADNPRPLLVHCVGGVDRSPMSVIFFLMRRFSLKYDDAWLWIRMHRPINNRRDWLDRVIP